MSRLHDPCDGARGTIRVRGARGRGSRRQVPAWVRAHKFPPITPRPHVGLVGARPRDRAR
eukprot:8801900-Pyramimonas_sp.AAC.1